MSKNFKLNYSQLNRHSIETYKKLDKTPVIVVLDNIRSAMNVGSIFRTADAFAVEKVILCGITATPPNKEILKAALGATDTVSWEHHANVAELVTNMKSSSQYMIISIEQTGQSTMLNDFEPQPGKTLVLVLGNEVDGVSQEVIDLSDACIEIPQYGTKHSLNVAVSAGIVLWELCSKIHSGTKRLPDV